MSTPTPTTEEPDIYTALQALVQRHRGVDVWQVPVQTLEHLLDVYKPEIITARKLAKPPGRKKP